MRNDKAQNFAGWMRWVEKTLRRLEYSNGGRGGGGGGGGGGGAPTGPAGGDLTGTYPNPQIAPNAVTSAKILDGTITDDDVAAANKDGVAAEPSLRTLGTGAQQAAAGNHTHAAPPANLTIQDENVTVMTGVTQIDFVGGGVAAATGAGEVQVTIPGTPTGNAGGDLTGSYPNPQIAPNAVTSGKIADGTIVAGDLADGAVTTPKLADAAVTSLKIADSTITAQDVAPAHVDGPTTTPGMRTLGSGPNQAAPGQETDARLDALEALMGGGIAGVGQVGEMGLWGTSAPPPNWLICDGSAVSRATYADLFAVIGTTYGPGDGSTTFNLPNLAGRFPMGKSAFRLLGEQGGSETHAHSTANHYHSIVHTHNTGEVVGPTLDTVPTTGGQSLPRNAHTHSTASQFGNDSGWAGNDGTGTSSSLPPYLVLNFIIRYQAKAMEPGTVMVQDEGLAVAAADILNFVGPQVQATDTGGGKVTVSVSGDGTPIGPAGGDLSGTYPNPQIAANAVGAAELADGAVDTAALQDGAITSAKIADGTIAAGDLAASLTNNLVHRTGDESIAGVKEFTDPLLFQEEPASPAAPTSGARFFTRGGQMWVRTPTTEYPLAVAQQATSLILNGGFEAKKPDPNMEPANWNGFWGGTVDNYVRQDATQFTEGLHSCLAHIATGNANLVLQTDVFAVQGGTTLLVEFDVKGAPGARTKIELQSSVDATNGAPNFFAAGTYVVDAGFIDHTTSDWTHVTRALPIYAGHTLARLCLRNTQTAGDAVVRELFYDNVQARIDPTAQLPVQWVKTEVRLVATTNITLSGLTQNIDGFVVAANDRILAVNQTDPKTNGIWVAVDGAWIRAADADTAPELAAAMVGVQYGNQYGGTRWATTFKASDTIGVTPMVWQQQQADTLEWRTAGLAANWVVPTAETTVPFTQSLGGSGITLDGSGRMTVTKAGVYQINVECSVYQTQGTGGLWTIVTLIHKRLGVEVSRRATPIYSNAPATNDQGGITHQCDALVGDTFEVVANVQYANHHTFEAARNQFTAHRLAGPGPQGPKGDTGAPGPTTVTAKAASINGPWSTAAATATSGFALTGLPVGTAVVKCHATGYSPTGASIEVQVYWDGVYQTSMSLNPALTANTHLALSAAQFLVPITVAGTHYLYFRQSSSNSDGSDRGSYSVLVV